MTTQRVSPEVPQQTITIRFLLIFLPLVFLFGGMSLGINLIERNSNKKIVETNENYIVPLLMEAITNDFKNIVSDLMFLTEMHELHDMLEGEGLAPRRTLAEDFLAFSKRKKSYDQIRFLDEQGLEIVRVNFNAGLPSIVPEHELQNKGERYYFSESFELEQGKVFISPFDLNVEHGQIEQPLKPMIRFGTPVFDRQGQKRGIVLLNYFGANTVNALERNYINSPGQLMLLNSDGFWFRSPQHEDEWGFMYDDRQDRTFGNVYPDVWARISGEESIQFSTQDGLFTSTTAFLLSEYRQATLGDGDAFDVGAARLTGKNFYWKIVSYIPASTMQALFKKGSAQLLWINLILLPVFAVGSWLLARGQIVHKLEAQELYSIHKALQAQHEQLANLNAGKDKFFSILAKDLQMPILKLIDLTSIIPENIEFFSKEELKETAQTLFSSLQNLHELLKNLFTWSGIHRGSAEYRPQIVQFYEVLERNKSFFIPVAEEKQIRLVTDVSQELSVYADPDMLYAILRNLLSNAMKFSFPGDTVTLSAVQNDQNVEVTLVDTGVGIRDEDITKLFREDVMFQRPGTNGEEGTGLGLILCKQLAEQHGGRIWIESVLDEGTTVHLTFPVQPAA
ncbi:MAG: hypothetical protein GY801_36980 [bacterium]|nr:hypothetical protein [bacterium]